MAGYENSPDRGRSQTAALPETWAALFTLETAAWSAMLAGGVGVPVGLYRVDYRPSPSPGDLVVVRLPEHVAQLADRRSYLPRSAYLVKPVTAVAGDRVCRFGAQVFVRHRFAVQVRARDRLGQPLPVWQGCRTLGAGQLFLLANHPHSFDSRYFGPIDASQLVGIAIPIWFPGSI